MTWCRFPVLPGCLRGWTKFTHGLYCDEFAEYQLKDIPARQRLGGFLPSNGVGTGFWGATRWNGWARPIRDASSTPSP